MSGELYNEYGDINHDNYSIASSTNKNKIYKALAKVDSNFIRVPVKLNKKIKKIGCYMSGNSRTHIINAVTGQKYRKHIIGTLNENYYFKVMICTGVNGQNPAILFFDSPGQYEKHLYTQCSDKIKDDWFAKLDTMPEQTN